MAEASTPRRYQMRRRADAVAATRTRILDTARALLAAGETPSIAAVAERAGLSRPTVYEHVRDAAGMLAMVIEDAQTRGGVPEAVAAAQHSDPVQAMHGWLRHAVAFWRQQADVLAPAWRQALGLPELAALFDAEEAARLRRANTIVQRLADARLLSDTISTDHAARLLWLLSGLRCYEQLGPTTQDLESLVVTWADRVLLDGAHIR